MSDIATRTDTSALVALSVDLGIKPDVMVNVIKAQCFTSTSPDRVSNEQLAAYVSVAAELRKRCPGFSPLLPGMLYAFPASNGGIQPMIGPDGVFVLLDANPNVDGWETEIEWQGEGKAKRPFSCTATIYLRDGRRPRTKTVYLHEFEMSKNPNWQNRPAHMLEIRALKQCARQIIHGLPMDPEDLAFSGAVEVSYTETTPAKPSLSEVVKPKATAPEQPAAPPEDPAKRSSGRPRKEQESPAETKPAPPANLLDDRQQEKAPPPPAPVHMDAPADATTWADVPREEAAQELRRCAQRVEEATGKRGILRDICKIGEADPGDPGYYLAETANPEAKKARVAYFEEILQRTALAFYPEFFTLAPVAEDAK